MLDGNEDYLGWLNSTTNGQASKNHYLAIKIIFPDSNPGHFQIGVDQNSTSLIIAIVPWWPALVDSISLQYGDTTVTLKVWVAGWVDYDDLTEILEVFVSLPEPWTLGSGSQYKGESCEDVKPTLPFISTKVSLLDTFNGCSAFGLSGMYVGLSGFVSTNPLNSLDSLLIYDLVYSIDTWTFNSDGLALDLPRNADGEVVDQQGEEAGGGPESGGGAEPGGTGKVGQGKTKEQERTSNLILAITIPLILVFLTLILIIYGQCLRYARLTVVAKKYDIQNGVLDRGCRNFKYKVLSTTTKGFNSSELLGSGGFGSVYKGKLLLKGDQKPTKVAVKRISATSNQGAQEFLAEVKIIGEAQHHNLVRLLGWCHEKVELLLVYDYMPNGSVDQHLFKNTDDAPGEAILTWSRRLKIMSGVAAALTYLHEEWEKRVIHRDVKCSNIMLDRDFNARLGDFGLAWLYEHDNATPSTTLAGTHGYMAPELFHTLKATKKIDVYSFGAVVLGVATSKKPILSVKDRGTTDCALLVDWVWHLYEKDALLEAADSKLENAYDRDEMIMFLKIGLLYSHPDAQERPRMREVLNIWKGLSPFPSLPRSKLVPTYALAMDAQAGLNSPLLDSDSHSALTICSLEHLQWQPSNWPVALNVL